MSLTRCFAHLVANRYILVLLTASAVFVISSMHFRNQNCQQQQQLLSTLESTVQERNLKLPRFCQPIPELNCAKLFQGDIKAMKKAKTFRAHSNFTFDPHLIMSLKNNCPAVRSLLDLPIKPLSMKEKNFPLAYVMIVHTDFNIILRLLTALYWPQNSYCIHVDSKANETLTEAIRIIASCYPNLKFLEARVAVYWGHPNILESTMRCFKVLKDLPSRWKYVQITSETDFPLKTNAEMIEILSVLNGSQDCALADVRSTTEMERVVYSHREIFNASANDTDMCGPVWFRDRNRKKPLPPGNVRIYKGWLASALTMDFVNFLFRDPLAQRLYQWFKDTCIPEEHYWATLIHNQHLNAPGSFPGYCYDVYRHKNITKATVSRYQEWEDLNGDCRGKWVRVSCLYGVEQLPKFTNRHELMAHKFNLTYQPAALYCLNELICNKTYGIAPKLNMSFYHQLPFVRYIRAEDKQKFVC